MATLLNAVYHLNFVRKKPKIMARIAKDYFYVRALGRNRLRTVDFAITYRCNSRCVMCSAKRLMENPSNAGKEEVSSEEVVRLWRQAARLGAIHINLTGGEPTTRKPDDIASMIEGINRTAALSSMVTNCLALKKADLERYAAAGLDTLSMSLESMDPEVHDRIRRSPGNFRRFMEVFGWAKELGLNICVSMCISAENFDEARRIIDFGGKNGVFVLLNLLSPTGANAGNDRLSVRNREEEFRKLLKIPHVRTDFIFNFRGGSGCPGGVEKVYITPFGEVLTCPHVQVSYGNIRAEPLARIYERISGFPLLKDFERKGCRYVFSPDYVRRIMEPTYSTPELPVSIFDHPVSKEPAVSAYLARHRLHEKAAQPG